MSDKKWNADVVYSMADRLFLSGEKGYFELYKEAAEDGDLNAAFRIGYCYANGLDIRMDEKKAFQWYEKAARKGHPDGLFHAAICCASGKGCSINLDKGLLYARKSQKAGCEEAENLVKEINRLISQNKGDDYYKMNDHKAQDIKELRRVISKISSREFHNELYQENCVYLDEIARPKSIYNENTLEITRIRADLGDDTSMLQIGKLYLEKDPSEVNPSADQGYYWLMKSAKCGNIDALKTLIAMFAGDLPNTTFIEKDHTFAWDLLRMLSWVHIDGLLDVKTWYEEGRFLDRPDYVEMLEACKGILQYRVVPKKYLPGWRDIYEREKRKAKQVRMQIYMDVFNCLLRFQSAGPSEVYTKELKEYIDKALKDEMDIFEDLAGILLYSNRTDLLDYLAKASRKCSQTISTMFEGCTIVLKYRNSMISRSAFEVKPDFSCFFRYRYLYFAREKKFQELIERMAVMLTDLFFENKVDSLQKIVKVIRTFNRILADNNIRGMEFRPRDLKVLKSRSQKLEFWKEELLHDFKIHALEELMAGRNVSEILRQANRRFVVSDMCFPDMNQLFTSFPMVSSRELRYTYYEDLINHNYDLSSADFSAVNRFDVCFDHALWEITKKSRSIAGVMMNSRKGSWELPSGMEVELDRVVEEYLDSCDGKVCGYWPSLKPIYTVHYSRVEGGKQTRHSKSITYMDSWHMTVDNPMGDYLRILQDNPPESDKFIKTLRLLYRYFAFRICWYEAVAEEDRVSGESLEFDITFRKLYQKWKKQYLHFAEMVVQYVECH